MDREESKNWINKTCGEGWLPLVGTVYDNLPENVKVTSVYQKWGSLYFYIDPWDEAFLKFLDNVNIKSMEMCEICGAFGEEKIVNEWIHILCVKTIINQNLLNSGASIHIKTKLKH